LEIATGRSTTLREPLAELRQHFQPGPFGFWFLVCYAHTQLATQLPQVFWFLVCFATTQLATQLRQRCIQVVRSNKDARKRLTESNGIPAMDFGWE